MDQTKADEKTMQSAREGKNKQSLCNSWDDIT